jgi:Na+/phosphate symporter
MRLATLYKTALHKNPLVTNCITASSLCVLGDSVAQRIELSAATSIEGKKTTHSFERSLWMAVWGLLVSGILCSLWLQWLETIFPSEGMTLMRAASKVVVNQIVMAPLVNSMFFAFITFTRPLPSISTRKAYLTKRIKHDLWPTIKRSCAYWGSLHMINFMCIPPQFTILFVNACLLIWNVVISLIGFQKMQ